MEFELIIDSHCHWGPSLTMGTEVTTGEVKRQQERSGVTHVVILPFPSTAIASDAINVRLLDETRREKCFIPYHYIREDYNRDGFIPVSDAYFGGKWHWMRGVQDSSSNYDVLGDESLPGLIRKLAAAGKPIIFEEELSFTGRFVDMAEGVTLIIPHLGMLGGDPSDFLACFRDNEGVYFDTALASRGSILRFVKTIGPHRVLFGSDIPFGTMKGELSKILDLPISDEDKSLILAGNLMRLTGWSPHAIPR